MPDDSLGISIQTLYRRMVAGAPKSHGYSARPKAQSLRAWQGGLRKRLLELLAIEGEPRPAPRVRFVQEEQLDGYVRRRGYMVAADDLAVPFYVLEPSPLPAMPMGVCIAAHGHGPGKTVPVGIGEGLEQRDFIHDTQRDYAVQAVRRGYLAIAPDLRGFGELVLPQDVADHRGGCLQLAMRSIQLARPLLGQRVSDIMQLIDWALARGNTDPARVVMTGNSGGGTMTLFTAAVERRLSAAAPSCYFSTFADSIMDLYHCPCNFVPGLQNVCEMSDLAGLLAPRPMLAIAGALDPIFPIDAVRAGFRQARRIYRAAGAPANVELYEGAGGHRYYADRTWVFFDEKLSGSVR